MPDPRVARLNHIRENVSRENTSPNASSTKSLKVVHGSDWCTLLLFDGTEPGALVHALSSRFGLGQLPFHLTDSGSDAVVPLTSALPVGLTLTLHVDSKLVHYRHQLILHETATDRKIDTGLPVVHEALDEKKPTEADGQCAMQDRPMKAITTPGNINKSEIEACAPEREVSPADKSEIDICTPLLQDSHRFYEEEFGTARSMPSDARGGSKPEYSREHSRRTSEQSKALSRTSEQYDPRAASFLTAFSALDASAASVVASDVCHTVERFSRLSSELANERTLLAWIRTALGAMRTVFSFLSLAATSEGWKNVILFAEICMMAAVLFAGLSGTLRYQKVREALRLYEPPEHFGRISIRWFAGMVSISCVAIAAGIFCQQFIT